MNDSASTSTDTTPPLDLPDRRDMVIANILEYIESVDTGEWSEHIEGIAWVLRDHGYDPYTIEDELCDEAHGLPPRKKTCRH
jgi:hypothetical protein